MRNLRRCWSDCARINGWWISFALRIEGAKMGSTTVSAGRKYSARNSDPKGRIWTSIVRLNEWLEKNDYSEYDNFDGLTAKFLRPFTFENKYRPIALQQAVRRF